MRVSDTGEDGRMTGPTDVEVCRMTEPTDVIGGDVRLYRGNCQAWGGEPVH